MNHINSSYSIIGTSKSTRALMRKIGEVAPYDVNVLIVGETGTGKELVARNIHQRSARASEPFETLNCSAIPKDLAEAELFGYDKGAFTGAAFTGKKGYFEMADRGTLLLDEISDMEPTIQPKILRAAEYGTYKRVGGTQDVRTDVRIISATNRKDIFNDPNFRKDLFYRLAVEIICIDPLRERLEDVDAIAQYFVERWGERIGRKIKVSNEALSALHDYDFPGNVRELQMLLQRAYMSSPNGPIGHDVIQEKISEQYALRKNMPVKYVTAPSVDNTGFDMYSHFPWNFKQANNQFKLRMIAAALRVAGNLKRSAELLGTNRQNLGRIIVENGMSLNELLERYQPKETEQK
jgi:transcriptional regulator with PAS, ATPase and Fis domain